MSIWLFIQIIFNVFVLLGLVVCLTRIFREKEDDPRLTQGLRLLQSKISILEDLSDHTETQVKQIMTLLDKKMNEVRAVSQQLQEHKKQVDSSIAKGQQVAAMIEEDIPHEKISEKKLEGRYMQAARLAHQGMGVDQILQNVDLPRAEVELIAKVNKKNCVYKNDQISSVDSALFAKSLEMPKMNNFSIEQTSLNFQKAVAENDPAEFKSLKLG